MHTCMYDNALLPSRAPPCGNGTARTARTARTVMDRRALSLDVAHAKKGTCRARCHAQRTRDQRAARPCLVSGTVPVSAATRAKSTLMGVPRARALHGTARTHARTSATAVHRTGRRRLIDRTGPDRARLDQPGPAWTGQDWSGLVWTGLDWPDQRRGDV
eukprot:IDg21435t1